MVDLIKAYLGGSPGLVVMGDNSCLKGRGFESRRHLLDGHFFTLICCNNCIEKTENIRKRGRVGPFKKIKVYFTRYNKGILWAIL